MDSLLTFIGLIGVVIVLLAYGLLTTGKIGQHDARYYWLNIAGTVGIAISLFAQWNLPSMVSQVLWIIVSGLALQRLKRRRV